MLSAANLVKEDVPGDGACAYWAVLLTIGAISRAVFDAIPWPLDTVTSAAKGLVKAMRSLRAQVVAWMQDEQNHTLFKTDTALFKNVDGGSLAFDEEEARSHLMDRIYATTTQRCSGSTDACVGDPCKDGTLTLAAVEGTRSG